LLFNRTFSMPPKAVDKAKQKERAPCISCDVVHFD